MAKIGKYSTGLKGSVSMSGGDIGHGNKGWESRSNVMGQFTKPVDPRSVATKGYAGAAKDPELKRPRAK